MYEIRISSENWGPSDLWMTLTNQAEAVGNRVILINAIMP